MNIYVPKTATVDNKLPVMVWIHGGAFVSGNSNRGNTAPELLVSKGVILVTLHYRLGVYGFMCLDTPDFPGNQGFKDQVLGLKWIHKNIDAFGGDENKITIGGHSAGGMAVNLHLLNDNEKYFQKAIILSGPASSPWTISESNRSIPIDIANNMGYNSQDFNHAMVFLSKQDPQLVVQKAYELSITRHIGTDIPITRVCIENQFEGVENFLNVHPLNANLTHINSIAIIIGFVDNELAFQYSNAPKEWFENYSYEEMVKYDMKEISSNLVDTLKHFYTGDQVLNNKVKNEITNFASDFFFTYPTERMIKKFVKDGAKDVFHYVFSYVGNRNYLRVLLNLTSEGATHADDLGYIFDMDVLKDKKDEDMKIMDVITTLYTNFVKYG